MEDKRNDSDRSSSILLSIVGMICMSALRFCDDAARVAVRASDDVLRPVTAISREGDELLYTLRRLDEDSVDIEVRVIEEIISSSTNLIDLDSVGDDTDE